MLKKIWPCKRLPVKHLHCIKLFLVETPNISPPAESAAAGQAMARKCRAINLGQRDRYNHQGQRVQQGEDIPTQCQWS